MKKKLIPSVVVAALLLLAVVFLPLPQWVNVTRQGTQVVDGAETGAADITVRGWYFHYLFFQDKMNADFIISPAEGSAVTYHTNNYLVYAADSIRYTYGWRYGPDTDGIMSAALHFTKGFQLVNTMEDSGDVYAASEQSGLTLEELQAFFPQHADAGDA